MKKLFLGLGLIGAVAFAASTYTTNYNLEKSADGDDNWGDGYRDNLDEIDSQLFINSNTIDDHLTDTTAAHAASAISSAGGASVCVTSDDVEEYLDCLAAQVGAITGGEVVLLATSQTITGAKTFTALQTFNAGITATGTITFSDLSSGPIYSFGGVVTSESQLALTRGGTAKSVTAVNGGIAYTDADSFEISAAGSSGQILRSGGAGAPTWSTATYPATAGSSGNVLVSDGTNFSASTLNLASSAAVGSSVLPLANGGTAKNMTAVNGGVVYTDADSQEVTSAGTSGQYLKSNGAAAPTFATFTMPTQQRFTSGTSQTYTKPAGVLYLRVQLIGGGGGGSGGGSTGGTGGNGGNTTFTDGTVTITGGGGTGGTWDAAGAAGGTATITGGSAFGTAMAGGRGQAGGGGAGGGANSSVMGGQGASTPFSGGGSGGVGDVGAGQAPTANSGAGGGGASASATANGFSGTGGSAGGYVEVYIPTPSATYTYSVGAAGTAGTAGTGGDAGGAGAAGYIEVTEYYQ